MNKYSGSAAARVHGFFRMNPPKFLGSQTNEDPQNLLDGTKKISEVMLVTENYRVELASYNLKDVAHMWYTQWKENRVQMQLLFLVRASLRVFSTGFSQ